MHDQDIGHPGDLGINYGRGALLTVVTGIIVNLFFLTVYVEALGEGHSELEFLLLLEILEAGDVRGHQRWLVVGGRIIPVNVDLDALEAVDDPLDLLVRLKDVTTLACHGFLIALLALNSVAMLEETDGAQVALCVDDAYRERQPCHLKHLHVVPFILILWCMIAMVLTLGKSLNS